MKNILLLLFILKINSGFSQEEFQANFINSDSITNFIDKQELSFKSSDVYILKNLESFKEYSQGYLKSPVIYVFNSEGKCVDFIHNANAEKKLSKFKRINNKPNKDLPDLGFWKTKIANFKTDIPIKNDNVDYTFVLNWGFLFGDLEDVKMIDQWYKVLLKQKAIGEKINIILLNTDLQKSWDLSPEMEKWVIEQVNNSL